MIWQRCLLFSFFLLGIAFFLSSAPAIAEFRYRGAVGPHYGRFAVPATSFYSNENLGADAEARLDFRPNPQWKFLVDLNIDYDGSTHDPSEEWRARFRDLYLRNQSSALAISLGLQTLAAEGPDLFNPAEILHSKDWKNPLQPKLLPALGVSLNFEREAWTFDLFFIPEQTPPRLPGENSLWWPRATRIPIESDSLEFQIPNNTQYQMLAAQSTPGALRNNIYFRTQFKTNRFEGQWAFYEGFAPQPQVLTVASSSLIAGPPKQILLLDSPVGLSPFYYRHQVNALTATLPLKNWILRGAANWIDPIDKGDGVPTWKSERTLGLERSFATSHGLWTLLLQHQSISQGERGQEISFLRSLFEDSWTLGLRAPMTEAITLLTSLLYDHKGFSNLFMTELSYQITSSLVLRSAGFWLNGPPETLLGLYQDHDYWFTELKYYF